MNYLSQTKLADYLNCSNAELIRYREKGYIKPDHKQGRRLMYDILKTEVNLITNLQDGYFGKLREICKRDIKLYIEENPDSQIAEMFQKGSIHRAKIFDDEEVIDDDDILNFNKSKALYEYNKALLKEMERLEKEKTLVKADEVKKVWEKHIMSIKSQLAGLPSKIVAIMPDIERDRAVTIRKIIDEVIKEVFKELAK